MGASGKSTMTRLPSRPFEKDPPDNRDLWSLLSQAGEAIAVRHCTKGHSIFTQGEAAEGIFYLQEGWVKISKVSATGKEAFLWLAGHHDFIGERALLESNSIRVTTATALTDCLVLYLVMQDVRRLLQNNFDFLELFLSFLVRRNLRLQESLADHMLVRSDRRLAGILLQLAAFQPDYMQRPIGAPVTQQLLAEMVGTTRPRISYFMAYFKKAGHIEIKNGTLYVNRSLLDYVQHGANE
jgi:CRP-like cAMP-binding protein